ncbi:tyrosine/phenylalanine carboxypeptidase domain-containing protein [Paenarthrobacter sp. NPDC089675]|uniref:tyrosine/phenylalanine carboxypeptidase domain-containing protein n=1 Tax=Paenarthrobacter TaxID=1742992 RepID=UPI00381C17CC
MPVDEIQPRFERVLKLARDLDDAYLREIVIADATSTWEQSTAIASRTPSRVTAWAQGQDGLPSDETMDAAWRILAKPLEPPQQAATSLAEDLVSAMQEALDYYSLSHWTIEVSENMGARASVAGRFNKIRVRKDLMLESADLRRLVIHEIGGHVLRWENARAQPEPLLSIPLGSTVATEEGLAVLLEQEMGLIDERQMRIYAARVIGVALSVDAGIVDVGRQLAEIVGPEAAAEIALRCKRGLPDPNQAGGPTKDHGYLTGYLTALGLDPRKLQMLRSVKWSFQRLPEIQYLAEQQLWVPPLLDPQAAFASHR